MEFSTNSSPAPNAIARILRLALQNNGLINPTDTALIFHDFDVMAARMERIKKAYPPHALHKLSIKANPLLPILKKAVEFGFGLEAASWTEVLLALKAGAAPESISFDSPAKTMDEIRLALESGIHLIADSLFELERINQIITAGHHPAGISLRINPQTGSGNIAITSVSTKYSKFGEAIRNSSMIVAAFTKYPWLNGLHVHVGSQGYLPDQLLSGIKKVYELYQEIAAKTDRKIVHFSLGGGFPVEYHNHIVEANFELFVQELQAQCPALFSKKVKLFTEYGRFTQAHAGWTLSKVESVKEFDGYRTAVTHLGADLFLRRTYAPNEWHYDFSVLTPDGHLKTTARLQAVSIAGPLCFAGDYLARDILLPEINAGDWFVIHDTGAYTLSMWSRYNSRPVPKILCCENGGETISILKNRETPDEIMRFWGG